MERNSYITNKKIFDIFLIKIYLIVISNEWSFIGSHIPLPPGFANPLQEFALPQIFPQKKNDFTLSNNVSI